MSSSSTHMASYGWPAVAAIFVLSSFCGMMLLPQIGTKHSAHPLKATMIKFLANIGSAQIESEQAAEIRAFFASDLFASSRNEPIPAASNTDLNGPKPLYTSLVESPLFLSLTQPTSMTGARQPAFAHQSSNHEADDLPSSPRLIARRSTPVNPLPSIRLYGDLNQHEINPEPFRLPALRQCNKAWFVIAEVQFNDEGLVDFCLVESTDCDPAMRPEVIKAIYQCRLLNSTNSCGGRIEIMFPAHRAKDTNSFASTAGQVSGSK